MYSTQTVSLCGAIELDRTMGGLTCRITGDSEVGGSCVLATTRSKRTLEALIERFGLLVAFTFGDCGGFLQRFLDAALACLGSPIVENCE